MLKDYRETIYENALRRRLGGGGPAPFDPKNYGDLKLWLDATDVAGTGTNPPNGTIITSWKDKSGSGLHGEGNGSPVLSYTAMGGKPGFLMSGAMMFYGATFTNTTSTSTTFAVATLDSTAGGAGRLVSLGNGGDDTGADVAIPLLRNGQGVSSYRGGARRSTQAISAYNTPFYASSVFDGTNNTVYVNGVGGLPVASAGAFNMTRYGVGGQLRLFDFWKGCISEVLVYNSALSTPSRQAVESYLATKWGI